MKDYRANLFRRPTLLLLLAALTLVLFAPAQAQRVRSRTAAAAKARDNEAYQRELRLKSLGNDARKQNDEQKRLLLTQIKEDFEQIQQINNETMRTVSNSSTLDYKLISNTLAEINKRARRLKTNLAMPDVESKTEQKADASNGEQLKQSLFELDDLIMNFVTNPLFQNPTVINVELSTRAGRDLEDIIHMSQNVKKCAERLNKSSDRR